MYWHILIKKRSITVESNDRNPPVHRVWKKKRWKSTQMPSDTMYRGVSALKFDCDCFFMAYNKSVRILKHCRQKVPLISSPYISKNTYTYIFGDFRPRPLDFLIDCKKSTFHLFCASDLQNGVQIWILRSILTYLKKKSWKTDKVKGFYISLKLRCL